MKRHYLVVACLMLGVLACDLLTDIQDTVQSLNEAVELLQEISESGTWEILGDGTEALQNADGYRGIITLTEGTTNATGNQITDVTDNVIWNIRTDASGNSEVQVDSNGEIRNFVIFDEKTYRVEEDGTYTCLNQQGDANEADVTIAAIDLNEVFIEYSALSVGVQIMSVAEEQGTESLNDFTTTRYTLVSKLEEALEILGNFPSDELQQDVDSVPEFYIDGEMFIDNDTGALVRFIANYANLEEMQGNSFEFDLLALGNQEPVPAPDEALITTPCETTSEPTATPE